MAKTVSGFDYYKEKNLIPQYSIANIHNLGEREEQEDSFGISDINDTKNGIMFVLADGMGGMANGKLISSIVVVYLLDKFSNKSEDEDNIEFLKECLFSVNEKIVQINREKKANGGSTVIACILKDDKLDYVSVGDSRICLYNNNTITKINTEHNYEQILNKLVEMGEITEEEANNNKNRAALTSYIGTKNELKIDSNKETIEISDDDKVIIMSDGIFGTLNDVVLANFLSEDVYTASENIENEILRLDKKHQDNFTAIIIGKNY